MNRTHHIEWPTVALFAATYAVWGWAVFWLAGEVLWLAVAITTVAIAFHASLQHEALHGHPTRWEALNTAIAWPPLAIVVPYLRFRDTHLAHHRDESLTDPHDDPESHFLDPADWDRLPRPIQAVMNIQNTLAGRMVFGPLVSTIWFLRCDWGRRKADPRIAAGWLWHLPAVLALLALLSLAPMPFWAYALAAYGGLSLLRIRTYLEHRAHDRARGRSVIIEDRGPLAFLFLNNNLHAVHHAHPRVAWYRLPALYRARRERFLAMNEGYRFASYAHVFRGYLFRQKDPVPHPLRGRAN